MTHYPMASTLGKEAVGVTMVPGGCGTCFKAITVGENPWHDPLPKGVKFNIAAIDTCPYGGDNKLNCPKHPGDVNEWGSKYHFDLYAPDLELLPVDLGENPNIEFEPIDCPEEILTLMALKCCGIWWKGQGCPRVTENGHSYGMCDPEQFDCPPKPFYY